ncbi:MAG: hypothetical protein EOO69_01565 [Moraxellaceae bacterium]|nr:MAG: hypothetical protein EOO69_01565 [Moraxellaceae bacterium]
MHKYNLALAVGLLFSTANAWALEAMDDGALAAQTGQDGITVALQYPDSTISFSEAIITDTNGMTGATGKASLVIAPQTYSSTQGVRFFKDNTSTTLATAPINIKMDADGNAGNPVLNAAISLPSDMERIRINPFSVYLATGSDSIFNNRKIDGGTSNTFRAGVTELLRINGEGIDTVFKSGDPVTINIQLGNTPQGHMFNFTGGSILCMGNNASCMSAPGADGANPIEIMSKNSSGTSSLKLGFTLRATNQTTGFRLNGFYGDVNSDGLTFGKAGTTDKVDLVLNNVIAGVAGAQDPNTFNNLKNGSMGNFGVVGATVSNLKMNVRGM